MLEEANPGVVERRAQEYLGLSVAGPVGLHGATYAEAGWQIESNLDRPELRPGEYVLVSDERLPAKARAHIRLRYEIMERDGQACRRCKGKAGSGRRLQVHHVVPVAHGGLNLPDNLETLCDACHAGVHAVGIAETSDELLNPELEPS
ncbi:MAG: HNH endonuclease [Candidatus Dormiibacterota bacterium]